MHRSRTLAFSHAIRRPFSRSFGGWSAKRRRCARSRRSCSRNNWKLTIVRFHRPPVVSRQDVPARSWDEVVRDYKPVLHPGELLMLALIDRIKGAWWSASLYAGSSHGWLFIVQTDPFDMFGAQVLTVIANPANDEFIIRYQDWETRCPPDGAFAKLEHVLRHRLKWIVETPVPWPEKEQLTA
jgi:hypothetical protein